MKKAPFIRRSSREEPPTTGRSSTVSDASSSDNNNNTAQRRPGGRKKFAAGASKLMNSITFSNIKKDRSSSLSASYNFHSSSESYNLEGTTGENGSGGGGDDSSSMATGGNHVRFASGTFQPPQAIEEVVPNSTGRRGSARRKNINASELTMGLSDLSADFLDLMLKSKGIDWLKSLSLRDPRFCIKMFFDDVARDGADGIEDPDGKGFHPELLSPLLAMFQRSR
jgi:hypothetical protein